MPKKIVILNFADDPAEFDEHPELSLGNKAVAALRKKHLTTDITVLHLLDLARESKRHQGRAASSNVNDDDDDNDSEPVTNSFDRKLKEKIDSLEVNWVDCEKIVIGVHGKCGDTDSCYYQPSWDSGDHEKLMSAHEIALFFGQLLSVAGVPKQLKLDVTLAMCFGGRTDFDGDHTAEANQDEIDNQSSFAYKFCHALAGQSHIPAVRIAAYLGELEFDEDTGDLMVSIERYTLNTQRNEKILRAIDNTHNELIELGKIAGLTEDEMALKLGTETNDLSSDIKEKMVELQKLQEQNVLMGKKLVDKRQPEYGRVILESKSGDASVVSRPSAQASSAESEEEESSDEARTVGCVESCTTFRAH